MSEITWITIADAAVLLKVKPTTVIRRIEKGTLPSRIPEDMPFTYDGKTNYEIRLDCLPQHLQYQYLYSHLPKTDICSVDLTSPRSAFGNAWLDEFLDLASLIRDVTTIRKYHHSTGNITKELSKIAAKHHISLATLYRITGKPSTAMISMLYTDPFYLRDHLPKTMCLWSCDLAFSLYLDSDTRYSQNDIFGELNKKRDKVLCTKCPYFPNETDSDMTHSQPLCPSPLEYMLVPNHRKTINRLLMHIPPQMILFARKGYREWRAQYGLFTIRDRPLLVNESWQGDHHKFDLFVRITIRKESKGRIYEKEIAVRPTLTAWLDSATGCFVGWVISIMPNSDTIAEAFCRAAVLTPGVPFRGLPQSVIVDCGKDYKSKLLEDAPEELSKCLTEETELNKRFSGLGLLPALGVSVYHALPYHPQSKPIERYFKTLEEKWICKLPGWCHNSITDRPDSFQKKLKSLLDEKELLSLEEFVQYFQKTILPEYHVTLDDETTIPELPGWKLSSLSMNPLQRYKALEKAKTITPDWSTISVLKMHHSPLHTVKRLGIRFKNTYYQADELATVGDDPVDILYHNVQPPYAPSSITVIHNNRFLCEAFPAEIRHLTGDSPVYIMHDADRQNKPAQEMKSTLKRIRQSASAILPEKAKSSPGESPQLYDLTFGPAVEGEDTEVSSLTNMKSKSSIQKDLAFLFGDD